MSTPADSHFDPDDPRLTAYALGELPDPADRAHVEALLAASPEARAELADLRAFTAALTAEYEQERLGARADTATTAPTNIVYLPEPRWGWLRPSLAAAAVLLLAGLVLTMLPKFDAVQVRGHHSSSAVFSVSSGLRPPAPGASQSPSASGQLAQTGSSQPAQQPTVTDAGQELAPNPMTVPPTDASSAPLLAQTELPPVTSAAITAPAPAQAPPFSGQLAPKDESSTTLDQNRTHVFGLADRSVVSQARPALAAAAPSSVQPGSEKAARREVQTAPEVFAGSVPTSPVGEIDQGRDLAGKKEVLTVITRAAPVVSSGGGTMSAASMDADSTRRVHDDSFNTAAYDHIAETPFLTAKGNPLSTFSVDVDTASYSIVRRFIENGSLPPPDAVRIEELLNYFPYDYAPPAPGDERPFAIHLEGAACPWNPDHRLVRIGLKGREMAQDKRPPSNLVFLIDVSGSMEPPERLPLIKESLRLLVERLTDNDHVAIVVYAGNSGLVLPSTNGAHKDTILQALDHLEAGGSTNGASGIQLAYKVAQENFIKGGTNRVILATDGDFNVGTTSQGQLVRLIEKEAKGGVFLTCLGVGTDNLKDSTMQKLADHGNGNYAYLDGIAEGKKVLAEQMSGTLVTIAKDVKIQVEFNPATVNSYRLIGYEKRLLRKEDFNDDRVDAGEIGAGHSVTALYEVVPAGQPTTGAASAVDALKYQPDPAAAAKAAASSAESRELLTVKIRHKAPDSDTSERSYEAAFVDHGTGPADYANASPDFKFAAAVASFGLVLRDSPYKGNATLGAAIELAQEGKGADASGYRAGFIELARQAQKISDSKR